MANLTRSQWPRGWVPSSDFENGDKEGLVRMNNLHLDEDGVLSLVRGINKVSDVLPSFVHTCYSKYINNAKLRYAALGDGSVYQGQEGSTSYAQLISGGNQQAAFTSTLGQVLICTGSQRKRHNGTNVYDLTPAGPTNFPGIEPKNQPLLDVGRWGSWTAVEGTVVNGIDFVQVDPAVASFTGTAKVTANIDTTLPNSPTPLLDDKFTMGVRIGQPADLKKVRIVFVLDDVTTPLEYYAYEWINDDKSPFNFGINAFSKLEAFRGDFERSGVDNTLDWTTIKGMQVSFTYISFAHPNNLANEFFWYGGADGQLNGAYDYMQVNVHDTGTYLAKSEMGPITRDVFVANGYVRVTPQTPTDPSVNEIWIYRRSVFREEAAKPFGSVPALDTWYRVLRIGLGQSGDDILSDEDALQLNLTYNENLKSVTNFVDDFFAIVPDFNGRTIYMTINSIYFSDIGDPGLIDVTNGLLLSGNPTSKNLWIKKVGDGILYIGTSDDIFIITGTLALRADGTIDINKRSLGLKYAPIASEVDNSNGVLYFMTADGWYSLAGTAINPISVPLHRLYQGYTQHGYSPVAIFAVDNAAYPVAYAKNRLWNSVPLQDGSRLLVVFDTNKQYWYPYFTDPISLFGEEDGKLIAGYGGGSGNFLREIDVGTSLDGVKGMDIDFLTCSDNDNLPRNRKDTFTFKITADTGNVPLSIALSKDGSTAFQVIGTTSFNGKTEKLITIANTIGLGKSFAVKLYGTGFNIFKLWNFTIEYDPRPEQLTYIRIPFNNLGTLSRKRFINYPFVIDTLGQPCEFFPLIDGQLAGPSSTFNIDYKGTHIHYFDTEQVGIDIGGVICGFFEFYNVNVDEILSEKLPVPATFLVIPQDNYGVPNRKRHSSYKFVINTRGQQVRFTPRLDGVNKAPLNFSTSEKQVVEYFFTVDTISINIGGTLESLSNPKFPFEFYGPIIPQQIEVLPPRLKEFRTPETNYGIAAKKRLRTIPIIINTNGFDVTVQPLVDNVAIVTSIVNTPVKQTAYVYFTTDIFGTDFAYDLTSPQPFEFYELPTPEGVEVLPVSKRFDQIGPIRFDKIAKLLALRFRIITGESILPIKVLTIDPTLPNSIGAVGAYSTNIVTIPNVDDVYEIKLPKTIVSTIYRIEIGPTIQPFHRYDMQAKVNVSGMQTDSIWRTYANVSQDNERR